MPDKKLFTASDDPNPDDYQILRKGSVYNIAGPHGREFSRYKSASIAGPRWEELTHTPWPYESSAYTSGMRLWELGIIRREHVGLRKLLIRPDPARPTSARPSIASTEPLDQPDQAAHEPEPEPGSPPGPKSVKQPPRESASIQRTSKLVQQALRPAKKYRPGEPKRELPSSAEKSAPRQPPKESKPRQHRLMFQENWDDYREPIKPDSKTKTPDQASTEDADTDTEDD